MWCLFNEKFEDARVIIRSGNSKNDNRRSTKHKQKPTIKQHEPTKNGVNSGAGRGR